MPERKNPQQLLTEGLEAHKAGQLDQALSHYQEILALIPDHADALHLSGLVYKAKGERQQAQQLLEQAIESNQEFADAIFNLGNLQLENEQYLKAIERYEQVLQMSPEHIGAKQNCALALFNMGNKHLLNKEWQIAKPVFKRIIDLGHYIAESQYSLGYINEQENNLGLAKSLYEQALTLKPHFTLALNNLGLLLQKQGDWEKAQQCYQQAVEIDPNFADAFNNLGTLYFQTQRVEEAIDTFKKAVACQEHHAVALRNLAESYNLADDKHQALQLFEQVLTLEPNNAEALAGYCHLLAQLCAWEKLQQWMPKLIANTDQALANEQLPGEMPFMLISRSMDETKQLQLAKMHAAQLQQTAKQHPKLQFHVPSAEKTTLRIGYLSADFHDHATMHLMHDFFKQHDPNEIQFNIYSYGPDDNSEYRNTLKKQANRFYDVAKDSDYQIAERINADEVDILIDLKGYTHQARPQIAAYRPAPIQISYLGYPGTMGADYFDYFITDRIVTPESHLSNYTECAIVMLHSYQVNDPQQDVDAVQPTRVELGLPENSTVFASFNQGYKITPEIFSTWCEILKAVPDSVLWLLSRYTDYQDNLILAAEKHGIDQSRLVFADYLPKSKHLARLTQADIILDTPIYNGHTTTSDALFMGVPVIALQGQHFASRVSSSLLTTAGLDDLIQQSVDDYRTLAIKMGNDKKVLEEVKLRCAQSKQSALFDSEMFYRQFVRAMQLAWQCYAQGNEKQVIHPQTDDLLQTN